MVIANDAAWNFPLVWGVREFALTRLALQEMLKRVFLLETKVHKKIIRSCIKLRNSTVKGNTWAY